MPLHAIYRFLKHWNSYDGNNANRSTSQKGFWQVGQEPQRHSSQRSRPHRLVWLSLVTVGLACLPHLLDWLTCDGLTCLLSFLKYIIGLQERVIYLFFPTRGVDKPTVLEDRKRCADACFQPHAGAIQRSHGYFGEPDLIQKRGKRLPSPALKYRLPR